MGPLSASADAAPLGDEGQNTRAPSASQFALVLSAGEGQFVEFKESASGSLARALVAFANAEGGRVYLGVTDDRRVRGADIGNRILSRIQDTARNCDPPVPIDIVPFKYGGHTLLMIEVPEGTQKPHGCSEGYFLRTGPSSQKMNRDELVRFVRALGQAMFDEMPCRDFQYPGDFSAEAFADFLTAAKVESAGVKQDDLLINLAVAKPQAGALAFNNAGVLFFAKHPHLFHLQSRITCILYQGTQRTTVLDRKEYDGVIAENVDGAMTFLRRHLPLRYEITGLRRKEIPAIPEAALREALLNAVIHRDYFERGGAVMVEISRDKVEITNPGGLVPGLRLENLGRRSLPRNPLIADLFFRMDEVEKAGTGIRRIREAISQAGLGPPVFSTDSFFSVSFPMPATPGHAPSRLGASGGTKSAPSRHQVKVLTLCRTPRTLIELLKLLQRSDRTKFRKGILSPLLSAGLLVPTIPDRPRSRFQKYATAKEKCVFTRKKALFRKTNKEMLVKHIQENAAAGSRLVDLMQVLPGLSRRQVQKLLQQLRSEGRICTQGTTRAGRWYLVA